MLSLNRLVPESIRWLISKKRFKDARRLILKAAKLNRRTVPDYLVTVVSIDGNNQKEVM